VVNNLGQSLDGVKINECYSGVDAGSTAESAEKQSEQQQAEGA